MRTLISLIISLLSLAIHADQWSFPAELTSKDFIFGATKIVRIIDARNDQTYPDFRLDIYNQEKLVGRYGGVYFEDIAASEENKVFIAISNSGLPYTAIILFDEQGRLRALIDHSLNQDKFDYCEQSVTMVRKWYDSENPSLKFTSTEERSDIQVRSCRGELISLLDFLS